MAVVGELPKICPYLGQQHLQRSRADTGNLRQVHPEDSIVVRPQIEFSLFRSPARLPLGRWGSARRDPRRRGRPRGSSAGLAAKTACPLGRAIRRVQRQRHPGQRDGGGARGGGSGY